MQSITYVVPLPVAGDTVIISDVNEPYSIHKMESVGPPYDSAVIVNDNTGVLSRIIIANGKWQIQHYPVSHTITFKSSPTLKVESKPLSSIGFEPLPTESKPSLNVPIESKLSLNVPIESKPSLNVPIECEQSLVEVSAESKQSKPSLNVSVESNPSSLNIATDYKSPVESNASSLNIATDCKSLSVGLSTEFTPLSAESVIKSKHDLQLQLDDIKAQLKSIHQLEQKHIHQLKQKHIPNNIFISSPPNNIKLPPRTVNRTNNHIKSSPPNLNTMTTRSDIAKLPSPDNVIKPPLPVADNKRYPDRTTCGTKISLSCDKENIKNNRPYILIEPGKHIYGTGFFRSKSEGDFPFRVDSDIGSGVVVVLDNIIQSYSKSIRPIEALDRHIEKYNKIIVPQIGKSVSGRYKLPIIRTKDGEWVPLRYSELHDGDHIIFHHRS